MPEFTAYAVGLCAASVCTSLDDEQATARINAERPTGVAPWTISPDATFADGTSTNPMPCPDDARNRHILFQC